MSERFDVEERWPDLFESLDPRQRRAVVQSLASSWYEGWQPNRDDVADLVSEAVGEIDQDEYFRRVDARAEMLRGTGGGPPATGDGTE